MRVYIIAIGGTGVRIMKSLLFMLASSPSLPKDCTIVPLIIDLDKDNGDTTRTVELLNDYRKLYQDAFAERNYYLDYKNPFFSVPLKKVSELSEGGKGYTESYHLNFEFTNSTFRQFIDFDMLRDRKNKEFIRLLYDDSDPDSENTELDLDITVGFKGNPNIGTVIFHKVKEVSDFRVFEQSVNEGDRIMLIGSLFGGTGAAGIPSLIKLFNNSQNAKLRSASKAAILVMPYFNIEAGEDYVIQSNLFNSKTKAALAYYEKELHHELERVYYLGDDPLWALQPSVGGSSQRNPAHVIELIGASAFLHYANDKRIHGSKETEYYEFGLKEKKEVLSVRSFFPESQEEYFKGLVQLALIAKFFKEDLLNNNGLARNFAFYHEMKLNVLLQNSEFFRSFNRFIDAFTEWNGEMQKSIRGFKFYDAKARNWENLIHHFTISNKHVHDRFLKTLEPVYLECVREKVENPFRKFIQIVSAAASKTYEEKIIHLPA